jgi:multidrug efflux pump subunit AcrB
VKESAEALGLSRLDLARQVRQGFYGEEAQRVQRGRHEVKVMVRYPAAERRSLFGVEAMRVRTPAGGEVPFGAVASVDLKRGYATIQRTDRKRTVQVTADVDTERANPTEIQRALSEDVLPGILARHHGVTFSLEGEQHEQAETRAALGRTFALALLAIFGLMAIPFRSYVQPLIVMTAIPFGLVGAVLGHVVMGVELSSLSLCGIAALAGVVVNDSLVMVDFVNRARAEGAALFEAVRTAGVQRFRPILLTSLTTFAGLTPLLLEKSVQAQFLIPMAISLAFGVLFSTLITLMLVPSIYLILEDALRAGRWLYGPRSEPVDGNSDFATT